MGMIIAPLVFCGCISALVGIILSFIFFKKANIKFSNYIFLILGIVATIIIVFFLSIPTTLEGEIVYFPVFILTIAGWNILFNTVYIIAFIFTISMRNKEVIRDRKVYLSLFSIIIGYPLAGVSALFFGELFLDTLQIANSWT